MKLLFVGYGKLARLATQPLSHLGFEITALARSAPDDTITDQITYWQGAISDETIQNRLRETRFDLVIITLSPDGRDTEAYKRAYLENVQHLTAAWQQNTPDKVFYVSSTRVYGQNEGEWVDENSDTSPSSINGEILLASEQHLFASPINTSIIRYSGIYGPNRDFLIRQVQAGNAGGTEYTNRIHEQDCVGVLVHLARLWLANSKLESIYLASDSCPAKSLEVRRYIADKLGIVFNENTPTESQRTVESKRCRNQRLLQSGYVFGYPTFKHGYGDMLEQDR